jgi:hypothetical protein
MSETLSYASRRDDVGGRVVSGWPFLLLMVLCALPPVYVDLFERYRQWLTPGVYPLEWPERQPNAFVFVAVSLGVLRPLGTLVCLVVVARAWREGGWIPYLLAGLLGVATMAFEAWSGFWDMH